MNYTSISQNKKLVELGLNPNSADMCYKCLEDDPYDIVVRPYSDWKEQYKCLLISKDAKVLPCWSVGALEDILPNLLDISLYFSEYSNTKVWTYALKDEHSKSGLKLFTNENRMEALMNAVCWDLENNFIKTE